MIWSTFSSTDKLRIVFVDDQRNKHAYNMLETHFLYKGTEIASLNYIKNNISDTSLTHNVFVKIKDSSLIHPTKDANKWFEDITIPTHD